MSPPSRQRYLIQAIRRCDIGCGEDDIRESRISLGSDWRVLTGQSQRLVQNGVTRRRADERMSKRTPR